MTCKKCNGKLIISKAWSNKIKISVDFIGDNDIEGATLSSTGPARLVNCLKCEQCGHSFIIFFTVSDVLRIVADFARRYDTSEMFTGMEDIEEVIVRVEPLISFEELDE